MRDRETKAPRGFAFITYVNAADADAAMAQMNGAAPSGAFQGRLLRVSASTRPR
jgi:RNA recognition motif-containing protein